MSKIEISTGHPDSGRVYAEAYDAALAREALLTEKLFAQEQIIENLTAHEAALRNDVLTLEKGGQLIVRDMHDYRQRLTDAEKFVQKMVDCTKGQHSVATGYLSDILDVIKGNSL